MIWVDRQAKIIKDRQIPLEWVDDMKTPSGRVHVGALRGVVIHDLMYKGLVAAGVNATFSYVINGHDPMDGMPSYLDATKWSKYMGMPLYKIPPPEKGYDSFAQTYGKEFIHVFESINCHPKIIWSSELYGSGKMDDVVRTILDSADKIRGIYFRVSKAIKKANWIPYTPVCEKCGKLSTTQAHKWDGVYVHYRCAIDAVKWTTGCGYEGKIKPVGNNGKLPWRLDWPATWKVVGVSIEGAGKDHMSKGGSYDFGSAICKEVLQYNPPYPIPYEWFIIGGRKMSSSKGVGATAIGMTKILPPEVLRFLIVRTPIGTVLDFDPAGDTIPNLFDDYDRCMNAYFDKYEGVIPQNKQGEVLSDFARIIELSEVKPLVKKRYFLPRFRTIANILKSKGDPKSMFEKQLGRSLSPTELALLNERITYANIFLKKYAEGTSTIKETTPPLVKLNDQQKKFIISLTRQLENLPSSDRESIQNVVFATALVKPKDVFGLLYQILTGKQFGPKIADLILELGVNTTAKKLTDSIKQKDQSPKAAFKFPTLYDEKIFSIHPLVKKQFPTVSVGVAIIKGVSIQKENPDLNTKQQEFLKTQETLTNEVISSYPEVLSYRTLYRQMKIDWHSRRPSPEALLRRVAMKKGLYCVNTCVDAYNLVVMSHRVSVGAFDLDAVSFPTILRFPNPEEHIHLLGDKEPTLYKTTELAYFDKVGGYNIDFNYRDAVRTKVTEQTKNILINIDGIYDITREMVERSLKETIDIITKYCGGEVTLAAIAV